METELYQALLVKSLDILSGEEESELDSILDNDETTTEQVLAFLKSKIPTFDRLVLEERLKLQQGTFSFA
jgi:hypothetical protein